MTGPIEHHFKFTRQVTFADTDMAGIMHFANYFRYMEEAEHAYYRELGVSIHPRGAENSIGWPRVHVECDFKQPARFEDVLDIYLTVKEITEKTIQYALAICREEKNCTVEIAHGTIIVVCASCGGNDKRMKAIPIPIEIRRKLPIAD